MAAAADDLPELSSPRDAVRVRSFMFRRSADHYHRGIDLPSPKGTPVYAVAGGRVLVASNVFRTGFSGYGRVVVIHSDDGTHHLYAHLDRAIVPVSDRIEAGQQIGTVGNSVFSTKAPTRESGGAHLHFEVSPTRYPQDSEAPRIDPVAYLRAGLLHPITRQQLGSSSAPPTPATPAEGSPTAVAPFGQSSHFSHCPCCGQRLPTGGKCDDHQS